MLIAHLPGADTVLDPGVEHEQDTKASTPWGARCGGGQMRGERGPQVEEAGAKVLRQECGQKV